MSLSAVGVQRRSVIVNIVPCSGAKKFFFFNDSATTKISPLSLHDALPIFAPHGGGGRDRVTGLHHHADPDRLLAERAAAVQRRSEEHTSELQSQSNLVCRLLLETKTKKRGTDCL